MKKEAKTGSEERESVPIGVSNDAKQYERQEEKRAGAKRSED